MKTVNERLIFLLNDMFKGNVSEFARITGVPQPTLNNIVGNRMSKPSADNLERIINSIELLDANWLITGKGNMLKTDNKLTEESEEIIAPIDYSQDEEYQSASEPLREYLPTSNFKLVPLVNLDIAGGTTNQEMDIAQYVEKYIPFVDAKSEDIACPVTNNSMSPIYPPGTIVQIRKIVLWREYIEYGQVYVVDLVDGRRLIKQVKKGSEKGKFILSSFNKDYEDNEIPIDMIYSMWLVIAKYEKVVM